MRSVFIYLKETDEITVSQFLQTNFPKHKGPPWTGEAKDNTPCLYISFYRDAKDEFEPEDWVKLVHDLGCAPTVCVTANVSGRHFGNEEVLAFIKLTLTKFPGIAQDDYTSHCWSLLEIQSGHKVQGHPFFDYDGWYKEYKTRKDSD